METGLPTKISMNFTGMDGANPFVLINYDTQCFGIPFFGCGGGLVGGDGRDTQIGRLDSRPDGFGMAFCSEQLNWFISSLVHWFSGSIVHWALGLSANTKPLSSCLIRVC